MLLQSEEYGKRRSRFLSCGRGGLRPKCLGINLVGQGHCQHHEIYPHSWDPGSRAGQDSTGFALIDGILSFGLSHQLRQAGRRSRD